MDGVVRDRLRMAINGHVVVTLIVDEDDEPLGEPWCELIGPAGEGASASADLVEVLEADLSRFIGRAETRTLRDDERLEKELIRLVRQTCAGRDRQEARGDGGGQPAKRLRPQSLTSRVRGLRLAPKPACQRG